MVSWRYQSRELINKQKMGGDSTTPCFTPLLRGTGTVVPTLLEEWKCELERRSYIKWRSGIPREREWVVYGIKLEA